MKSRYFGEDVPRISIESYHKIHRIPGCLFFDLYLWVVRILKTKMMIAVRKATTLIIEIILTISIFQNPVVSFLVEPKHLDEAELY
jgi:hypothetical protein